MTTELYPIKNKIPGLSYAYTLNGVELPTLDITHPFFTSSIDEIKLKKMLAEAEKSAEKNAEKFNRMPAFIKNFLANHSFVMSEMIQGNSDSSFLSGVSTLMFKLGPNLIGKGKKRFLDRLASKGIGGIVLRMRVRDISRCQAEAMIPILRSSPSTNLCMINIAGGAANDSINTLFLILKEDPTLLENRKIEINILDIDKFGPAFAENCIAALKAPEGKFNGLNISLKHIHYDWNNTDILVKLISERKGWLQFCSSEGGLFEYCSDELIIQNLDALYANSNNEIVVVGSLIHEIGKVDAGIVAALKISTRIKPRFLGKSGLNSIVERRHWKLESVLEGNPRYLIFALKKRGIL